MPTDIEIKGQDEVCETLFDCASDLYCDIDRTWTCKHGCDPRLQRSCPDGMQCLNVSGADAATDYRCVIACDDTSICPQGHQCTYINDGLTDSLAYCLKQAGIIGAPCNQKEACRTHLYCETQVPGGACLSNCKPCSADCEAGEPCAEDCIAKGELLCPGGGRCFKLSLGDYGFVYRCVPLCQAASDCRPDYACKSVPNYDMAVCLP